MPVTTQALAMQAQLDATVQAVTDRQEQRMVAAWVYAWAEASADLSDTLVELLKVGGTVSKTTMRRSLRLRAALTAITGHLQDLATEVGVVVTSDLQTVIEDAARAQEKVLRAQLPNDTRTLDLLERTWTSHDDRTLAAIVERSTQSITSRLKPLSAEADTAVRRELVRAVVVGDKPREAARRMVRRAERGFNGGLTRALVISRTEILDAHRAGAGAGQDMHTDVLGGWVWLTHLDQRTCPACVVRNGTVHPLDEPGPEDHPQGRCARMPRTKSWADLGFDVDEPEDQVPDARAWFDSLSEPEQVAMFGRRRLDLLQSGAVTWDDLASRRSNPGWRSSWQVTPLKDLLRQRSGGRAAS